MLFKRWCFLTLSVSVLEEGEAERAVIVTAVLLGDDNEIGIEEFAFGGVTESAVAFDVFVLLGGTEAIRHFVVGFGEFGLDAER